MTIMTSEALPDKGEKRVQAILALGDNEQNATALLQLAITEKGKCKTAAQTALARLDYPLAADVWRKLVKGNNMGEAVLMPSCSDSVSDAIAATVSAHFSSLFALPPGTPLTVVQYRNFKTSLSLMLGNATEQMQQIYCLAAKNAEWLSKMQRTPKGEYDDPAVWIVNDGMLRMWNPAPGEFKKLFPAVLTASIIKTKDQRLSALADKLYRQYGGSWLMPVFMSRIVTQPAAKVFEQFAGYLEDQERSVYLFNVLGMLIYSEQDGDYQAWFTWGNYSYGRFDTRCSYCRTVGFDQRWLYALANKPYETKPVVTLQSYNRGGVKYQDYDEILLDLLPRKVDDGALKDAMREYFAVRVALEDGETTLYTDAAQRFL